MLIDEVFTVREASEKWEIPEPYIKSCFPGFQGLAYKTFGIKECRKSSRAYLISAAGMNRIYGPKSGIEPKEDWAVKDVYSTSEAARIWGVGDQRIRDNLFRFRRSEYKLSGRTLLVTKAGMDRLYGGEEDGNAARTSTNS
jgi:hypothetical protein